MSKLIQKTYIFVIETDAYAGNFEREINAYSTGVLGEHFGHEKSEAEEFIQYCQENNLDQYMFNDLIDSQYPIGYDGSYNPGPCSISQNDNGDYNNVSIFMYHKPTSEDVEFIKNRAIEFSKNFKNRFTKEPRPFNILGFKLFVESKFVDEEQIEI